MPPAALDGCSCRISQAGLDVDGSDISPDMLERVRERCAREGLAQPNLYAQAMHELDLPRRYRTILVCGGFGLGGHREHDVEGLRRLYVHLEPGGTLVLDNEVSVRAVVPRGSLWLKEERESCREPWRDEGDRRPSLTARDLELRSRLVDVDPLAQCVDARDARRSLAARTRCSPRSCTA